MDVWLRLNSQMACKMRTRRPSEIIEVWYSRSLDSTEELEHLKLQILNKTVEHPLLASGGFCEEGISSQQRISKNKNASLHATEIKKQLKLTR